MNLLEFSKRRGRHRIRPTEEELLKLYVNHTAKEIAEMYGVSNRTVEAWVYNYRNAHKKEKCNQDS